VTTARISLYTPVTVLAEYRYCTHKPQSIVAAVRLVIIYLFTAVAVVYICGRTCRQGEWIGKYCQSAMEEISGILQIFLLCLFAVTVYG